MASKKGASSCTTKKALLCKTAREVFEEATAPTLGSSFHIVISFHLKQKIGKDPYEILIEEPRSFYNELEKLLSKGAETLVRLVGRYLAEEYGIEIRSPEVFVQLLARGDESSKNRMQEILMKVVCQKGA